MSFEEQEPVPGTIPELPEMTYEEGLAFSQKMRRQIVATKMAGGVPRDNDDIKIVLSALKDHDTTAISDRKNRIEESTSQSSAEIAQAMVEMVKQQANVNPFARRSSDGSAVTVEEAPAPPPMPKLDERKLGDHELVPGEGEIGVIQESSESFFNRMGMGDKGDKKE